MTTHVGIDHALGQVFYFKDTENVTSNFKIKQFKSYDRAEINSLFEEIKSKLDKKLGCACFCLTQKDGNEIRKSIIKNGLKFGFKNIEIINWQTAFYLNAMTQVPFKPENGNVIWIKSVIGFHVWQIIDQNAKYFGRWSTNHSKIEELEKIVNETKLTPNFVLSIFKNDEELINKISPICKFLVYSNEDYISKGSLIKARINAGDQEVGHLKILNLLSQKITLNYANQEIKIFEIGEELPIFCNEKLLKVSPNNELIIDYFTIEKIKLPDFDTVNIEFQVGMNGIYSLKRLQMFMRSYKTALLKTVESMKCKKRNTPEKLNNVLLVKYCL